MGLEPYMSPENIESGNILENLYRINISKNHRYPIIARFSRTVIDNLLKINGLAKANKRIIIIIPDIVFFL